MTTPIDKSEFQKLNLFRDKLQDVIEDFFFEKDGSYYENIIELKGNRHRLNFSLNGNKEILDFRFNIDETTTIDLTSGKLTDTKIELANYIKNSPICTFEAVKSFENPYFVFENLRKGDVKAAIDIILEIQNVELISHCDISGGERWVISSEKRERVTITFYNPSSKTVMQGKPLKLFSELYTEFLLLVGVDEVPKVMEQNFKIEIADSLSKEEILASLESYIPNAFHHLDDSLKKFLSQSLLNLKISIPMFEYSFLAFPALKALEGHLKYIMKDNKIPLVDNQFSMFRSERNAVGKKFYLEDDFHGYGTLNPVKIEAINDAYTYFNSNRHALFHWGKVTIAPVIATTQIDNIGEAHGKIQDVFKLIDQYYKTSN